MGQREKGAITERAQAVDLTPQEFCRRMVKLHGSILRAAINLGVSPHSIRYWLQKPEQAKQA